MSLKQCYYILRNNKMGRKINTRNKNFLADLQARMKDRYNSIHNGTQYSEIDKQHEEPVTLIVPKTVEPVNATVPKKVTAQRAQETALADFEKEYQDFIAKLKAKKEAKEKAMKEMEEQKEEIKPEVEEKPKRKRKTTKNKDESTPKKENN